MKKYIFIICLLVQFNISYSQEIILEDTVLFSGAFQTTFVQSPDNYICYLKEIRRPTGLIRNYSFHWLNQYSKNKATKRLLLDEGLSIYDVQKVRDKYLFVGNKITSDTVYFKWIVVDSSISIIKLDSIALAYEPYDRLLYLFGLNHRYLFDTTGSDINVIFNVNNINDYTTNLYIVKFDSTFNVVKLTQSDDFVAGEDRLSPSCVINKPASVDGRRLVFTESRIFELSRENIFLRNYQNKNYNFSSNGFTAINNLEKDKVFFISSKFYFNSKFDRTQYTFLGSLLSAESDLADSILLYDGLPANFDELTFSNKGSLFIDLNNNFQIIGGYVRGDPDSLSVLLSVNFDNDFKLNCKKNVVFPWLYNCSQIIYQSPEGINYMTGALFTIHDYEGLFIRQKPVIIKLGKNCDCLDAKEFINGVISENRNKFISEGIIQNTVVKGYLYFKNSKSLALELFLYDLNGIRVQSHIFHGLSGSIEVESLPLGIYLYSIGDGNRIIESGKLTVVH